MNKNSKERSSKTRVGLIILFIIAGISVASWNYQKNIKVDEDTSRVEVSDSNQNKYYQYEAKTTDVTASNPSIDNSSNQTTNPKPESSLTVPNVLDADPPNNQAVSPSSTPQPHQEVTDEDVVQFFRGEYGDFSTAYTI